MVQETVNELLEKELRLYVKSSIPSLIVMNPMAFKRLKDELDLKQQMYNGISIYRSIDLKFDQIIIK